jgi:D-apiose dehydrogenase
MAGLRVGIFGTGFWSNFQIPAWFEVGGVKITALYNRTVAKAERVAEKFHLADAHVYGDPEELLRREEIDFMDIITEIDAHAPLVLLAAKYKIPVICQKPMAPDLATAEKMVAACRSAGVPFFVHENFRWQTPIRALKQALDQGLIGKPFRAQLSFLTGFSVFDNQPFMKTLEHLIITDLGSHQLDLSRCLFGEATRLYCQTSQVQTGIRGEDAATIVLDTAGHTTVVIRMAYAGNPVESDHFPMTSFFVEGEKGTIELSADYWLRITTRDGTLSRRVPPPHYAWADPNYDVVHASIVPCNGDLLKALKGEGHAETTGADNLKTVRLVFAAYDSAASGKAISL